MTPIPTRGVMVEVKTELLCTRIVSSAPARIARYPAHRYAQVQTGTHRYTQVHPGTRNYTQIHPGTPRYTQLYPGTRRYT